MTYTIAGNKYVHMLGYNIYRLYLYIFMGDACIFIGLIGTVLYLVWWVSRDGSRYPSAPKEKSVPVPVKEEVQSPAEPVLRYQVPGDISMLEYDPGGYNALNFKPLVRVPEWYISKWVENLVISPAEQLIINELEKYDVEWHREISFRDMPRTDKGGVYRFDFLLPIYGIVIEYHGRNWHTDTEKVKGDQLKERFCIARGMRYITYSGRDYFHMDHEISELMSGLRVLPRNEVLL